MLSVCCETLDDTFQMNVEGVANYRVQGGQTILVDPVEGVAPSDVRVFLLASCCGSLLIQRQILALHASAIAVNGGAALIAGHSGLGKSALAAVFHQRGRQIFTDDIAAVSTSPDGTAVVHPGLQRIKLWHDTAEMLSVDTSPLEPVRLGIRRYSLPIPLPPQPAAVKKLFILTSHNHREILIQPIEGVPELMRALLCHLYRPQFLAALDPKNSHFPIITAVASQIKAYSVVRPDYSCDPRELADKIEEFML